MHVCHSSDKTPEQSSLWQSAREFAGGRSDLWPLAPDFLPLFSRQGRIAAMPHTSSSGIGNVTGGNALVEMAMGYARSRVLCAAARLGLADLLGDEGKTVD